MDKSTWEDLFVHQFVNVTRLEKEDLSMVHWRQTVKSQRVMGWGGNVTKYTFQDELMDLYRVS